MASGRTRDVQKESYWRQAVREQAGSGLAVPAWCLKHRVKVRAFYRWRSKLVRRDAENASMSFVPVRVREDAAEQTAPIEIVLTGGQRVCIRGRVDRQALTDVLTVLEGQAC
jgi:hypothetical protein